MNRRTHYLRDARLARAPIARVAALPASGGSLAVQGVGLALVALGFVTAQPGWALAGALAVVASCRS